MDAYNALFLWGLAVFITFEGIEGCGKSTQIKFLAEYLRIQGQEVLLTREPGGCSIADQIRSMLLDAANREMVPVTELMLYASARAQHVAEVIQPALKRQTLVLCDRFSDATRAYQAFGRGIERQTIETLNSLACSGLDPDVTVLLDCPVEVGLQRARQRIEGSSGPREERFELESLAFHQKVRDGYLQLAAEEPQRFIVIDAQGTPEQIAERIQGEIVRRLKGPA